MHRIEEISDIGTATNNHNQANFDQEEFNFAKPFLQPNFQRTIKPLPRKRENQIRGSVVETHQNQRKHKLFQELEPPEPRKQIQYVIHKKGNVEFKIPKIKQYYVDQQQNVEYNIRVTNGLRMPTLLIEQTSDEQLSQRKDGRKEIEEINSSRSNPQKSSLCTVFVLVIVVGMLMGAVLLADYYFDFKY